MSKLVRVDLLDPSPFAERYADAWETDLEYLNRLTADIKRRGIQSPLHVYPRGERFEVVAGHNRLQAAKRLGLVEVPVDLRMLTDDDEREEYFIKDNPHRIPRPAALARAAVLGHPEWTLDRVAEFVGVGHTTVQTVRKELTESGHLSETGKVKGTDGKKYPSTYRPREPKTNGISKHAPEPEQEMGTPDLRPRSARIPLAEGETPEEFIRRAIAESPAASDVDNAARVGIHRVAFAQLKKIVALADDSDLKPLHAKQAASALQAVNAGGSITDAFESVKEIADAKFGEGPTGGGSIAERFERRLKKLERAIISVTATGEVLPMIEVPAGIPREKRDEWVLDMEVAAKALHAFIKRVREA